jgi:hypothetical protein
MEFGCLICVLSRLGSFCGAASEELGVDCWKRLVCSLQEGINLGSFRQEEINP